MSGARTVLRGGMIVDPGSSTPRRADLLIKNGLIVEIGDVIAETNDVVIDVTGRYLMPGFIDTHTHADGAVFREDVQRALLRQGVTTVIAGQDGVSYAPGSGQYASEYFAALNGPHPSYDGGGVASLLASYDRSTPINVGYVIPAGTVRHEVKGYDAGTASANELAAMRQLVAEGLEDGALGLSTGLDYVPGIYQDTAELIEMNRPVSAAGGLYVSHMRGGYGVNSRVGIDEITAIALGADVRVHVSHYVGPSDLLVELLDEMGAKGVDFSFDAYPYRRSSSLLTMKLLPPALLSGSSRAVAEALADPAERRRLVENWFPSLEQNTGLAPDWADTFTLAHIAASEYEWAHGMTVGAAARRAGTDPDTFALDLLVASNMEVGVVMKGKLQRTYDDLAKLFTHPAHTAGSDGIYIGRNPHPRAWGTFAKFLRVFTRERGDFTWNEIAGHLSGHAAARLGLANRGRVEVGYVADIAVVDPLSVADEATYENPRTEAVGVDDVFVSGVHVLEGGRLTGEKPGRALRRAARSA
jgi:N-acyl-D-amino-acid deacylase